MDWNHTPLLLLFHSKGCFICYCSIVCLLIRLQAAFVGRCFDAYGPTVLVISGTLLTVFGLMVSLCKTYYQLALAEGVVLGVGTSVIF